MITSSTRATIFRAIDQPPFSSTTACVAVEYRLASITIGESSCDGNGSCKQCRMNNDEVRPKLEGTGTVFSRA